jgi:hypothetical protein
VTRFVGDTPAVKFERDPTNDWAALDAGDVIDDFDWLIAHRGARSDRRMLLSFRQGDGSETHFELRPAVALEMAAELSSRVGAEDPPEQ